MDGKRVSLGPTDRLTSVTSDVVDERRLCFGLWYSLFPASFSQVDISRNYEVQEEVRDTLTTGRLGCWAAGLQCAGTQAGKLFPLHYPCMLYRIV